MLAQGRNGAFQIHRVPEDDGGYDQIETARAVTLVLEAAVAQVTLPVEEHGAVERVPGFALIKVDLDTPAQLRVFHPLKHEKRALDPPDFTKRGVKAVLTGIAGELADGQRSGHGAVPDGCSESTCFLPLRSNQFEVELAADQRSECWMVALLARNTSPRSLHVIRPR
jgi:hypothetical protein